MAGRRMGVAALAGLATRITITGLAGLLAAAAQGQALVDDLEGGHSINRFGGMWSFSGDFWDKGDSKILSAVDTSLQIPFFKGGYGGGYPDGTGHAAKLHFRFGLTKPGTPPNTYDNNVNMTAPFGADDAVLDLTGAASFSFYAKSDRNLQVEVVLPTLNITDWAYYSAMITATPTWTKHTIKLATGPGGLTRRNFGVNKPLDLAQALGIQWEVNKGKNASVSEAILWIDEVYIEGYTYAPGEPRGSCIASGCVTAPGQAPSPSVKLADFEGADPGANVLGLPWNHYSSSPMGEGVRSNEILGGYDAATGLLVTAGKGHGGGNGGWLDFALGQTWFTPEGFLMLPTVSLTTQLTADTGLNVTGSAGLWFLYRTTGDVEYIDLRVRTTQIHADNGYAVPYVKVKGTGGEWKAAQVKWTDFILPNWGPAFREAEKTMVFTALLSAEWSVSSARKDAKGSIAIDEIHLLGISALPEKPLAIGRRDKASLAAAGPRRGAWMRRGLIHRGHAVVDLKGRLRN